MMKASKVFFAPLALILLVGGSVFVSAQATKVKSTAVRIPVPVAPSDQIESIELSDGVIGFDAQTGLQTMFGYSFMGQAQGSLPGSFWLTVNCAPAYFVAGGENQIMQGTWGLSVYDMNAKTPGYVGSLHGSIAKGAILWDWSTGTEGTVILRLNIDGSDGYAGATGSATFEGKLVLNEKSPATMTGTVTFDSLIIKDGVTVGSQP